MPFHPGPDIQILLDTVPLELLDVVLSDLFEWKLPVTCPPVHQGKLFQGGVLLCCKTTSTGCLDSLGTLGFVYLLGVFPNNLKWE